MLHYAATSHLARKDAVDVHCSLRPESGMKREPAEGMEGVRALDGGAVSPLPGWAPKEGAAETEVRSLRATKMTEVRQVGAIGRARTVDAASDAVSDAPSDGVMRAT
jgi:hypothetical protein